MEEAPHEQAEAAEAAEQHPGNNRKIALLIAVLAFCLAVSETLSKSAQTTALSQNIEAANLWAFFQGKTARMTTIVAQADTMEILIPLATDADHKKVMQAQVERWRKDAARYDDEAGDGRKQLTERAKVAEERRDKAEAQHHHLRDRLCRVPDLDRARVGGHHHGHHGPRLGRHRPWCPRHGVHWRGLRRSARAASILRSTALGRLTPAASAPC